MTSTIRIYHHNDMDGLAAASVVKNSLDPVKAQNSVIKYYCINYEDDVPQKFAEAKTGDTVWVVDYSFTKATCNILYDLIEKDCNIIWIDHHASSIELEKTDEKIKLIPGIRSNRHSGALLAYTYTHGCTWEDCPLYIKLISDYDTFQRKMLPDSDFFKLGYDAEENKMIALELLFINISNSRVFDYIKKGKIIKNFVDADNKSYCKAFGFETTLDGYKVFAVNKKGNSWLFGKKYDEYDMVCSFVFNGEEYSYSIFSAGKVDCFKIAEKFGGGGHPGAAGFRSKELVFGK